jgi:MraZ protein
VASFRGTFDYTLDAKNRLTVPARFRDALKAGVVMAKATEPCVQLWPAADYDGYVKSAVSGMHPLSDDARSLRRFFSANAHDTDLDSANRVMFPSFLLEHAGLEKEVVVTGGDECLEVWDRETWAQYNASLTGDIRDITARLGDAPS